MAYDSKCYDLAQYFLEDEGIVTNDRTERLAQEIQGTIEDFIEGEKEVAQ